VGRVLLDVFSDIPRSTLLTTRNSKASDTLELSDGISVCLLKLKLVYFDGNTQKISQKTVVQGRKPKP
jgi:hypothetical protein